VLQTTTDVNEQNNTGPLDGPVIGLRVPINVITYMCMNRRPHDDETVERLEGRGCSYFRHSETILERTGMRKGSRPVGLP